MSTSKRVVQASDKELSVLKELNTLLCQFPDDPRESDDRLTITSHDAGPFAIPESLRELLSTALEALSRGDAVMVLPHDAEMTTQEAADYLGMSRPFLISLLDEGKIPYTRLRSHRRLLVRDVEAFRVQRIHDRMQALDELTREMSEAGLYTMDGIEEYEGYEANDEPGE